MDNITEQDKAHEMNSESLVSVYQTIMDSWNRESDRFWSRNNLFLLINAALLTAISTFAQPSLISLAIAVLGIYFTGVWILVSKKGAYYVRRWRPVLERIEKQLQSDYSLSVSPMVEIKEKRESLESRGKLRLTALSIIWNKQVPKLESTELMRHAIIGFLIAWMVIAVYILKVMLFG